VDSSFVIAGPPPQAWPGQLLTVSRLTWAIHIGAFIKIFRVK
jgi:hypothetical protein